MNLFIAPLRWLAAGNLLLAASAAAQYPPAPQLTKDGTAVWLQDFAAAPFTSRTPDNFAYTNYPPPATNKTDQLSRLNFLRAEPPGAPLATNRFFVCDLNRHLYTLDRATLQFSNYLDFEATFAKFDNNPGFAGGLVTFQFDPGYAANGIFYTVHTENPNKGSLFEPANTNAQPPVGYTNTPVISPPVGTVQRHAVLIEWTDTNLANATFEGTARELLRVGFTGNIHPMGDLIFNPLAQPGDWDYGNLYIANGDGGAGEANDARHSLPQRLDTLVGKILRLTPNLNLRPADPLGANGCYRIPTNGPDPNPFAFTNAALTNLPGLRKEIFAYGFRNPHRLSWDAAANVLLANDIGLNSWEEVNVIHKGTNYGYAEREGTEQMLVSSGLTGSQVGVPFPTNTDFLTVTGLVNAVAPTYPVASYSHRDGDAISSGFVYRGQRLPQLRGKYLFGDITTGRLLYANFEDMLAADDAVRTTQATIHELQIVHDGPYDTNSAPVPRRLFDVVSETYHARGGTSTNALPGAADATTGNDPAGVPYGRGRADIRLAQDGDGELYLISKSDGMIRQLAAALSPPAVQVAASNGVVNLAWSAVPGRTYRVQTKTALTDPTWTDLAGDVLATGLSATKVHTPAATQFYRVVESPNP